MASVRQRVENLRTFLDSAAIPSVEALEDAVVAYFCDEEVILSDEDIARIEEMAASYEQFN